MHYSQQQLVQKSVRMQLEQHVRMQREQRDDHRSIVELLMQQRLMHKRSVSYSKDKRKLNSRNLFPQKKEHCGCRIDPSGSIFTKNFIFDLVLFVVITTLVDVH